MRDISSSQRKERKTEVGIKERRKEVNKDKRDKQKR
jgi:hypothetical protein